MLSERKAIEVRIVPITLYAFSSLLTFGLAIGILRARAKNAQDKIHLFNYGTIRFGRLTLGAMIVVFMGIFGMAASNFFPKDPERVELEIKNVEKYTFKYDDKVLGMRFLTTITDKEFKRTGFPTNPSLTIAIDLSFYNEWYISAIEGFTVNEPQDEQPQVRPRRVPIKNAPVMIEFSKHASGRSRICVVQFHNLNPTEKYEFMLYLHPREGNPALSSDAKSRDRGWSMLKNDRKQLRLILQPPGQLE